MVEPVQAKSRQLELQAEAMEAQHELLTALMRTLTERDAAGALKAELSALLRQLESSTALHFREEEVYMADLGHPKLDTHQVIHRELLAMLQRHMEEFEQGSGRLGCKLVSYFKYWLASHIDGMDRHLAHPSRPLHASASGARHLKAVRPR